MPIFNDTNMETHRSGGSSFGFSARRVNELGATEYTLVGIAADTSGSVDAFRAEIEATIKEIVSACRSSPRSDNLMLRLVHFDDASAEIHGFRPLSECPPDSYTNCVKIGGLTALYDATVNVVDSVTEYGQALNQADYSANAIIFVITDGHDNKSTLTMLEVKSSLERAVRSEALESVVSILIGVNVQDARLKGYLSDFSNTAGFTQYVELGDAKASSLEKLAAFVSRSISAQSQALGTGGPSKALSF